MKSALATLLYAGWIGILYINGGGYDVDTIIRGGTDDSLVYIDGGLDAVGMGGAAESGYKLKVTGSQKITGSLTVAGDEATIDGRHDNNFTLSQGFNTDALPAGYAWAGAPFATPSTVDLTTYPSMLTLSQATTDIRAFLYTSTIPGSTLLPVIYCGWSLGSATSMIGIRMDDGSDNNYIEWLLSGDLKGTMRTRVGGGAVATVQVRLPLPLMYGLRCNRTHSLGSERVPCLTQSKRIIQRFRRLLNDDRAWTQRGSAFCIKDMKHNRYCRCLV
jgi:hypothetical protein